MSDKIYSDVTRRHDFVLLFDVKDGNPNGDPDADNMPRVDPETLQGLVTDVALKRKVRDWVDMARGTESAYKIYVQHRGILANQQKRAFEAIHQGPTDRPNDEARAWMCKNFYDVRTFGAVMTVGKSGQKGKQWNCGQVRGPVQITFARSIDPILPLDFTITRTALTNADDTRRESNASEDGQETAASGQMGRKAFVPYGLYLTHGFFNPHFAKQTGTTQEDLDLFWQALQMMWDVDRSSSRGLMACQGVYVFTHESRLGNAPAHRLFDRIKVARREGVEAPRSFRDYDVAVNDTDLPAGVTLTSLEG